MLQNRGSTRTSTAIAIVPAQLAHLSGAWNLGGSTFRGDIHGCEKPLKSQGRERNANFRCPTNGQYATFNVIKFEQYVKDAETIGSYYSLATYSMLVKSVLARSVIFWLCHGSRV